MNIIGKTNVRYIINKIKAIAMFKVVSEDANPFLGANACKKLELILQEVRVDINGMNKNIFK